MARKLTAQMLAAVTNRSVRPILLVNLNFASAPVNLWSGYGNITVGCPSSGTGGALQNFTFTGAGTLGTLDKVPETSDGSSQGVKLTLTGIPLTLIALAVEELYQGGLAQIWLGCFDINTNLIVITPYLIFAGSMDVMAVTDGTKSATISLSCENRLIELDRPRERRYSDFDQQIDYPGDTGLQYVNSLQDLQIYWGDPNGPIPSYPGAGGIGPLNK